MEKELLERKGHKTDVLLFDNADAGVDITGKLKAGVSTIYNSASAKKLKEKIRLLAPDIIHIHNFFFMASPSIILEAFKSKIPVIVTIQNFRLLCVNALFLRNNRVCELCKDKFFPYYGIIYKCYHNSVLESAIVGAMGAFHKLTGTWQKKVDRYITPAIFMKTKLINSSLKLRGDQISIKRNFINDPGFTTGVERKNFFLFVGRLAIEKGIETIVEAISVLSAEQLIVVGDGPEKEKLLRRYSQSANINFIGKKQKPEVLSLMKECKALLFPSIWFEGLPLTIVEAFATGTPVLASRLGAMEEMVQPGVNGLLFDPGDARSITDSLNDFNNRIVSDDYTMYEGARNSYLNNYHPDKCYQQIIQIYQDVIKEKRTYG
jgi:glycosyltransferase involved in cell wall biosynthesis